MENKEDVSWNPNQMMIHENIPACEISQTYKLDNIHNELNSAHGTDLNFIDKDFICERLLPNYYVAELTT